MTRRSFLSAFPFALPVALLAQSAILKDGKALVCSGATTTCPNQHKTCRNIDAPIVVGNDNRNYTESGQLFDKRVLECSQCGVLFIEH